MSGIRMMSVEERGGRKKKTTLQGFDGGNNIISDGEDAAVKAFWKCVFKNTERGKTKKRRE